MATFEETMRTELSARGMFDKDVEAQGYPPQMLNALRFTMDRHALEYIDANCPQAWFRPLFVHGGAE